MHFWHDSIRRAHAFWITVVELTPSNKYMNKHIQQHQQLQQQHLCRTVMLHPHTTDLISIKTGLIIMLIMLIMLCRLKSSDTGLSNSALYDESWYASTYHSNSYCRGQNSSSKMLCLVMRPAKQTWANLVGAFNLEITGATTLIILVTDVGLTIMWTRWD